MVNGVLNKVIPNCFDQRLFDVVTESEGGRKRLEVGMNDGKNPSDAASKDTEYYEIKPHISHDFIFQSYRLLICAERVRVNALLPSL